MRTSAVLKLDIEYNLGELLSFFYQADLVKTALCKVLWHLCSISQRQSTRSNQTTHLARSSAASKANSTTTNHLRSRQTYCHSFSFNSSSTYRCLRIGERLISIAKHKSSSITVCIRCAATPLNYSTQIVCEHICIITVRSTPTIVCLPLRIIAQAAAASVSYTQSGQQ